MHDIAVRGVVPDHMNLPSHPPLRFDVHDAVMVLIPCSGIRQHIGSKQKLPSADCLSLMELEHVKLVYRDVSMINDHAYARMPNSSYG